MIPRPQFVLLCVIALAINVQRVVCASLISSKPSTVSMKAVARSDPAVGKVLAKALIAGMMIGIPFEANAVPLGTHTTCAWPTCTSQLDILKDSAPALVSQVERGVKKRKMLSIKFPHQYNSHII